MAHIDAAAVHDLVVAENRRDHCVAVVAELDIPEHFLGQGEDPEPTVAPVDRAPQTAKLHYDDCAPGVCGADGNRLNSARV